MLKKDYLLIILLLIQCSLLASSSIEKYYLVTDNKFDSSIIYEKRGDFLEFSNKNNAFGLESKTVWLYIKITNNSKNKKSNIIEFPYPLLDYINVLEYEKGILIDDYLTGDLTKFDTRKVNSNTFVIPYEIQANSSKEFIFAINSKGTLNLKMNFSEIKEFTNKAKDNAIILGIYYGAILIMLVYNLFLYFIIKEKVYLYYVLFHFFYLFVQLTLNGLAFEYFWPNIPEINTYFIFAIMTLTNFAAILFTNSFLEIKNLHKKLYNYFRFLKFITVLLFISNFIMSYSFNAKAIAFVSIITVSSLFVTGLYILLKDKTISSRFFVIAWSFILIGILLTEFSFIGVLPINLITLYANQIGAMLELSLLSIALAYRYNYIFSKLSQRELQLSYFNEKLEQTIKERTQTINTKNKQLSIELKNKNILHKELFHRVKNNLHMVSSILYTHSKKIKDKDAIEVLENSMQTISSIGMIHERLYKSGNLEFINFNEYLFSLINYIKQTIPFSKIIFEIKCTNIMITLKNAVPLGLIVNEIITNSIKHAFNDNNFNKKIINVKIQKDKDNILFLNISDNGSGIKDKNFKKNFGFKLIESLVKFELKGNLKYFSHNGLFYKIKFKDIEE